ncbi:MAG: hypothetical protein U0K47_07650 [Erysipelotrichaceae bacterium]|nr:hypothetical protein [Lactimicrobium massiliense]MDD6726622.1 hypothetical protein [Lactimicrobium massiliense]MEE1334453.1 hypothetical protein [Erysipelotrichaceae bacterium]
MMLNEYEGKKVIVETIDHKIFRGFVGDYIFPEDNNNGEESIVIDAIGNKNPVELFRSDISSISIIE